MNPIKIVLATLIIFVSGVLTGGFIVHTYSQKRTPDLTSANDNSIAIPTPWLLRRADFIRRIRGELDLSPQQEARVQEIIYRSQDHLRPIWEQISPQLGEELRICRQQISAELTPEQQTKFQKLLRNRAGRRFDELPSLEGHRQRRFLFPDGSSKVPPVLDSHSTNSTAQAPVHSPANP